MNNKLFPEPRAILETWHSNRIESGQVEWNHGSGPVCRGQNRFIRLEPGEVACRPQRKATADSSQTVGEIFVTMDLFKIKRLVNDRLVNKSFKVLKQNMVSFI
jgi:hypothetical protein